MCEGVGLLKQWKQGNTLISKPKRPLEIGVFSFFYNIEITKQVLEVLK